jgi:hypothetical protein
MGTKCSFRSFFCPVPKLTIFSVPVPSRKSGHRNKTIRSQFGTNLHATVPVPFRCFSENKKRVPFRMGSVPRCPEPVQLYFRDKI